MRGDWQLLPWIFGARRTDRSLPALGVIKMLDNLRRSVLAPATLAALALSWTWVWPAAVVATLLLAAAVAMPAFLPSLFSLLPRRSGVRLRAHATTLGADLALAAWQTMFSFAFLADQAWRMGDAILRTLARVFVTHRNLLEWTTAARAAGGPLPDRRGFYRAMGRGTALGVALAAIATAVAPASWPVTVPFAALWLGAPLLARWASLRRAAGRTEPLSDAEARALRMTARQTWRYFETFVTSADNMLPPDNFQETPTPVAAHRTSPTNIGLYLLAAVAARDFGWMGTWRAVERLEATLATMQKLQCHRGHFLNWYATADLRTLDPAYVSSVDSGNLAGHLVVLANACEAWMTAPLAPRGRQGMADTLVLAQQAMKALPPARDERGVLLAATLDEIAGHLAASVSMAAVAPALARLGEKAARIAEGLVVAGDDSLPDLTFWISALQATVAEHARDRLAVTDMPTLQARLKTVADTARAMALAMDFAFLIDPARNLLSIGYSLPDGALDANCYDLLASEARLASLFAIAKGDVATKHWFRLGRPATLIGSGSALVSWSGSMFEYLMPLLVMHSPAGSLLEQTDRVVVARQQSYAGRLAIPWGMSESAYNSRDVELTYQYANFGIPGLGLKRGLADDRVVAPYATGLAAMVDPHAACVNYARLAGIGALGRYGFYEALDFTRARLPDGEPMAIIRSFMAHHQGMTIVALANTLHDGEMRARFHREPMIRASELLLQERMPRDVVGHAARAEEVKPISGAATEAPPVRRITLPSGDPPVTHLLSNGRYAVMLTDGGGGYSRWRDIALTRWQPDVTRDACGSFVFLRDTQSGQTWSAGTQPVASFSENDAAVFGEDHAAFHRQDGTLTTTMEVLVSGESDGEVRRVSLSNRGRRTREIELTSYAELVLTTAAADTAHPAFAKMFVQTSYLAEFGALIATRRPRSSQEPPVWAAHFAVVEGELVAEPEYESDRARFLGRNRSIAAPAAMVPGPDHVSTVPVEHHGDRAGPDLRAALPHIRRARESRADRVLDGRCIVTGRAARSCRQASPSQRLRPCQNPGLDAGAGPAASSRHRGRGGSRFPAPRRTAALRRSALPGPGRRHPARRRPAIRAVATWHLRRPADRPAAHRRE